MIPDGTSIGVVSAARWYQIHQNPSNRSLAIDPYLCGTVSTFCSDAPIGDSAPTTSCYMTGIPQQAGNVAIYPLTTNQDILPLDSSKTYQPLATILEAAKQDLGKATGMVVTCEFPHATPADCSSHYYDRGNYDYLAPQIAYQNMDVMFGGGVSIVTDDMKKHFVDNGTIYQTNDIEAFRSFNGKEKIWSLFCDRELPYDLDRDSTLIPSLAEMTEKAINRLSQNENGFFLMVEGSKVDWAAHGNDPAGIITEYLAFDRAVGKAIEFAKRDGQTTVIVLPDHGNSGFTLGSYRLKNYSHMSINDLFDGVSKYKRTGEALEKIMLAYKPDQFKEIFKKYTDIDLSQEELNLLLSSKNYKHGDYTKVGSSINMASSINKITTEHTGFGFTTGGHTGEEVFLAAYHPQGDIPVGMNVNTEINQYLSDAIGLKRPLSELTADIFAKHNEVFKGLNYSIETSSKIPVLKVKKGKNILKVPAFSSVAYLNDKPFDLGSVTVYIDKNNTFYLPKNLISKL